MVGRHMTDKQIDSVDWWQSWPMVNAQGKITGVVDSGDIETLKLIAVGWNRTKKQLYHDDGGEPMAFAYRRDVPQGARESVEVTEAAKKRKPYEEVYYKWFSGVQVDIMDIGKIAKEIQAALDSKADLEKVMPELVKKYRKN